MHANGSATMSQACVAVALHNVSSTSQDCTMLASMRASDGIQYSKYHACNVYTASCMTAASNLLSCPLPVQCPRASAPGAWPSGALAFQCTFVCPEGILRLEAVIHIIFRRAPVLQSCPVRVIFIGLLCAPPEPLHSTGSHMACATNTQQGRASQCFQTCSCISCHCAVLSSHSSHNRRVHDTAVTFSLTH